MSLPTRRQAYAFLEPLRGKSVIFLIESRKANLALSQFILCCLAVSKLRVTVLDTSCLYGVNIRKLTAALPKEFLQQGSLLHLPDNLEDEDSMTEMVAAEAFATIIDDLNAVLQLLSSQGRKFGIHRLSTFFHILSYNARINRCFVLGTVYMSDYGAFPTKSTRRSLPKVSDLQVVADVRSDEIVFQCKEVGAWPIDGFRVPIYLDPRT